MWQHEKKANDYTIELDKDFTPLDFSHRPIIRKLTYVHTLQNLYFGITGEELVLQD